MYRLEPLTGCYAVLICPLTGKQNLNNRVSQSTSYWTAYLDALHCDGRTALRFGAHYVNLTEYVAETKEIMELVKEADTGFGLQSGVAPGFVNVLGKALFEEFCSDYGVDKANALEMRVGALGRNAVAPHFYNFTWSPIGVGYGVY